MNRGPVFCCNARESIEISAHPSDRLRQGCLAKLMQAAERGVPGDGKGVANCCETPGFVRNNA